jgi:hypothetical protein
LMSTRHHVAMTTASSSAVYFGTGSCAAIDCACRSNLDHHCS